MHRSVVAAVFAYAEKAPDSIALIDEHGGSVSYGALARDVTAAAARLHAWGVRAGDTLALGLDESPPHALPALHLFYAAAYLGTKVLLLFPTLAPRQREELPRQLGARLVNPRSFEREAPPGAGEAPRADQPERAFLYEFTSGSTGAPKVLLLSHAELTAQCVQIGTMLGFSPGDRLLTALRWPSIVGLRHLLVMHAVGGTFVNSVLPFERPALAELVRRHGITHVRASPAQLRLLLASSVPPGFRMPPLRAMWVAGAPLAPDELRAARAAIAPRMHNIYGATEIGAISGQHPDDPADAGGRLAPGIEAEVVDRNDRALPAGTPGQLRLRAPWLPRGYLGADAERQFRDGWFYPGDLARLDVGGRLTLMGRSGDAINRGGAKIDPRAVERVLAEHPCVKEAAVVGIPDAIAGEVPVAFLVLDGAPDTTELAAFLNERLDVFSMPAQFRVVRALERSPEGKILYGRLREIVARKP